MFGLNRYSKNTFLQAAIAAIMEVAADLEKEDRIAAKDTGITQLPNGRNIYGYTQAGDEMYVQTREEDIRAELKKEGGQTVLIIWHEFWGEDRKVDLRLIEPALAKLREKYPQLIEKTGHLILVDLIQYSYFVKMRKSPDHHMRIHAKKMLGSVRHELERRIRNPFEEVKSMRRSQNGASRKGGQKTKRRRPRKDRQRKDRPANTPMSKQRSLSSGALNLDFLKDFGKKRAASKQEAPVVDQPQETPVVEEKPSAPADKEVIETKVGETHPVDVVAESGEDEERPFALDKRPGERHSAPVLEEHKDLSTAELLKIYSPRVVYPFTRGRAAKAKRNADEEASVRVIDSAAA